MVLIWTLDPPITIHAPSTQTRENTHYYNVVYNYRDFGFSVASADMTVLLIDNLILAR